jgi:hypothetical protein
MKVKFHGYECQDCTALFAGEDDEDLGDRRFEDAEKHICTRVRRTRGADNIIGFTGAVESREQISAADEHGVNAKDC